MRRPRAPFVVTVAALGVGCGNATAPAASNVDDGQFADALEHADSGSMVDAADAIDALEAETPENTVGNRCTADGQCDPNGSHANFCSNDGSFSFGTLYPEPVCLGRLCTPSGDLTVAASCDGDHGVCVATGSLDGVCLPRCTFDGTGAAAAGCADLDPCTPYAWSVDATGAVHGVGYCTAGCRSDADCTGGDKCQVDQGYCVTRTFARTLPVGSPCSLSANPPEVECDCLPAPNTGDGYCSQFCVLGDARTSCPSGFVCSAALPSPTFDHEPQGAAGNCLKTCVSDADCLPIYSLCIDTPSGKVCQPDARAQGDAGFDVGVTPDAPDATDAGGGG